MPRIQNRWETVANQTDDPAPCPAGDSLGWATADEAPLRRRGPVEVFCPLDLRG